MNFRLPITGVFLLFTLTLNVAAYAESSSEKSENQEKAEKEYVHSLETELSTPPAESLLMAIFLSDPPRFKELLEQGEDVNATDGWGIRLLNHAAALGETEIMQMIIDAKADINAQSGSDSSTAAHSAVHFGQLKSLKVLVKSKADLTITNADGKTPGQVAEEYQFDDIVEYLKSIEASKNQETQVLN